MAAGDPNERARHALRALMDSQPNGDGVSLVVKALLDVINEKQLRTFVLVSPHPDPSVKDPVGIYSLQGGNDTTGELKDAPAFIMATFKLVFAELEGRTSDTQAIKQYLAQLTKDKMTVRVPTDPVQSTDASAGAGPHVKLETLGSELRGARTANALPDAHIQRKMEVDAGSQGGGSVANAQLGLNSDVVLSSDGRLLSSAEVWLSSIPTYSKQIPGKKGKFYVVKIGVLTGLFADEWPNIQHTTITSPGSLHKSFGSKEQATRYLQDEPEALTVRIFQDPLQGVLVIAAKYNYSDLVALDALIKADPTKVREHLKQRVKKSGLSGVPVDDVLKLIKSQLGVSVC